MKKVRSYTSIWNVEKVIYAVNDMKLPIPLTFTQIKWLVVSFMAVLVFNQVPPLSFIENPLIKFIAFPILVTWFMSQKSFDDKKPFSFLGSVISYLFRAHVTYAGKPIKLKKQQQTFEITVIRSEFEHEVSH